MRVGFIGLGKMGSGMAANLLAAGHDVTVYNRSRAKADPLAAAGADVASAPKAACDDADAVFTMLADDTALEAVSFGDDGILLSLPVGAVHISSSTVSTALSRRLAVAHRDRGQYFIAAPVFGRPDAAREAQLFVVAAGSAEALTSANPLLEAIGQRIFVVGEKPEAANLVKLSGNFLLASVIESLGEAMTLVGKAGIEKHNYLEILTSTLFGAPAYRTYGALVADEKFQPAGFAAVHGFKDIRLALAAAEELSVPLPTASLLRDRFVALLASGGADLDWSAIAGLASRDAGLPGFGRGDE